MRALAIQQRSWFIVIIALALFVRALIPNGYMIAPSSLKLTVQICAGETSGQTNREIEVPLSKNEQSDKSGHPEKSAPCGFSVLSMASIADDHSPLKILALADILATIVESGAPILRHQTLYLRPPLRGPPSFA